MLEEKRMTTPQTPVAAGVGQSINKDNSIVTEKKPEHNGEADKISELLRKLTQRQNPNTLPVVSLGELMDMEFPIVEPIIENMLYQGTYLLAGAPKIGKSFLVGQLAYHISTGTPFLGNRVRQGAVLYLALEDTHQRLQERFARMFGEEIEGELFLSVSAKQLGKGLQEQMKEFVNQHKNASLIVIDTLQKVREVGGDAYSYASDYELMNQFKTFGEQHGVSILMVHHTRKQQAGDSFDMISGTTGLLGCADGAFVMKKEKRTDNRATLELVGRDQPDQKLYLLRNEENLQWELEGVERELWKRPPDALLEQVAQLVTEEQPEWRGSASELAELVGDHANGIVKKLNRRARWLYEDYGIVYQRNRGRTGSQITLIRERNRET